MSDPVRLTVVPDEGEAEMLCGLLRSEGIRCRSVVTDVSAWTKALLSYSGWREILVAEEDLLRARELLAGGGFDVRPE